MTARATLQALRIVFTECDIESWQGVSNLVLKTKNDVLNLEVFRHLRDDGIPTNFDDASLAAEFASDENGKLPAGSRFSIQVPRSLSHIVVSSSLRDVVSIECATEEFPNALILVDEAMAPYYYCRGDDIANAPPLVHSYYLAVELWGLLRKQAHHTDQLNNDLLFFSARRLQIAPGFSLADVGTLNSLDPVADFLKGSDNSEIRKEIFAAVLTEYLRDHDREDSFAVVIRSVKVIGKRLMEGLAIYLAANSPAKLAAGARAEYVTLSEKLEKLIASIEVKSLAIPVSLLLCAKEAEKGAGITGLNFVLLASVIGFIYVMEGIVKSQKKLLDALQQILDLTHSEYKRKGLDEENTILIVNHKSLSERVDAAKMQLGMAGWASWSPLVALVVVMFFVPLKTKDPAKDAQKDNSSEKVATPQKTTDDAQTKSQPSP